MSIALVYLIAIFAAYFPFAEITEPKDSREVYATVFLAVIWPLPISVGIYKGVKEGLRRRKEKKK